MYKTVKIKEKLIYLKRAYAGSFGKDFVDVEMR